MKNLNTTTTPPPNLNPSAPVPEASLSNVETPKTSEPAAADSANTAALPPAPPARAVPINVIDPVATAKAQLLAAAENLQAGLNTAKATLGHALRVMIANQFPENDGGRRIAENTFETVKNIPEGKGTRADLDAAALGLTNAVNHIANHTLKFPGDLDQLREGVRKVNAIAAAEKPSV